MSKILHSNWLVPKKKEPMTSNRVISEEELADRRIRALAKSSMRMETAQIKLPTSEALNVFVKARMLGRSFVL